MKRENSIKKAIAVWTISLAIVMVLSCVFAICLEKANIIKYKENAIDTYISATASTDGSLETPTIIYNAVYDGTEKNVEDYLEGFDPLLMEVVDGGKEIDAGKYFVSIKLKDTLNYSWADGTTTDTKIIEWTIEPATIFVIWNEWEFIDDGSGAYTPKIHSLFGLAENDSFDFDSDFEYKLYDEADNLLRVSPVSDIGAYKIVVNFKDTVKNYTLDSTTKEWSFVVVPKAGMNVVTIEWGETSFVYDGEIHFPTFVIKDRNGNDVTTEFVDLVNFSEGYFEKRNYGTYRVRVTLKKAAADEYFIRSGSTCIYKITDKNGAAPGIEKTKLDIPTFKSNVVYDGSVKNVKDLLEGFDPLIMEIMAGGKGRAAGTYLATIRLKDYENYCWADNTIVSKQIQWKIEPATLYVNWDEWEFVYDGVSAFAPKINKLIGLVGDDTFDFDSNFVYRIYDDYGNINNSNEVDEIGAYSIVASFKSTFKNYTLDEASKEWRFVVVPKMGMNIITLEWGETSFICDGKMHYPTFTIKDRDGNDVTAEVIDMLKFSDGYYNRRDIGTYRVRVELKESAADEYFIFDGAECIYKITFKNGYAPPPYDGEIISSVILDDVPPLWPLIASGISVMLIILFVMMALGYNNKRKLYNDMSDKFGTVYAIGFLGMGFTAWTTIACTLMCLAVLSLVMLIIAKKKYDKAKSEYEARLEHSRNKYDLDKDKNAENICVEKIK